MASFAKWLGFLSPLHKLGDDLQSIRVVWKHHRRIGGALGSVAHALDHSLYGTAAGAEDKGHFARLAIAPQIFDRCIFTAGFGIEDIIGARHFNIETVTRR